MWFFNLYYKVNLFDFFKKFAIKKDNIFTHNMENTKTKPVVLVEGFKGDCCGQGPGSYIGTAYNYVLTRMALAGKIDLICTDLGEPKNIRGLPPLKQTLAWIRDGKIRYFDKNNLDDYKRYENLKDIDFAFIVTWNRTHSEIAKGLLGKAKKIFVEKPLDVSLRSGYSLGEKQRDYPENMVFGFDHYLAKVYPLLLEIKKSPELIGEVREVTFHVLEPIGIPTHRIEALNEGMVYDILCHGIALAGGVLSANTSPNLKLLKDFKLNKAVGAKFADSPIRGDTFSEAEFEVSKSGKSIRVNTCGGKLVGWSIDWSLEVEGSKGRIFGEIDRSKYRVFDLNGKLVKEGRLLENCYQDFLESIITEGNNPLTAPGVFPFEVAQEILSIVDEVELNLKPTGDLPIYRPSSTLEEIREIIRKKLEAC